MSEQNVQGPQIPIVLLKKGAKENKGREARGTTLPLPSK